LVFWLGLVYIVVKIIHNDIVAKMEINYPNNTYFIFDPFWVVIRE